jgi:hypothetical protein
MEKINRLKTYQIISYTTILLTVFYSCQGVEPTTSINISECLQNKIDSFKLADDAIAVEAYKIAGEDLYWFVTNARFVDGIENVYDQNCNLSCTIGGFRLQKTCSTEIQNSGELKVIVWKK